MFTSHSRYDATSTESNRDSNFSKKFRLTAIFFCFQYVKICTAFVKMMKKIVTEKKIVTY